MDEQKEQKIKIKLSCNGTIGVSNTKGDFLIDLLPIEKIITSRAGFLRAALDRIVKKADDKLEFGIQEKEGMYVLVIANRENKKIAFVSEFQKPPEILTPKEKRKELYA